MKTRKFCLYCGHSVVKSYIEGYMFYCKTCNIDLYNFEASSPPRSNRNAGRKFSSRKKTEHLQKPISLQSSIEICKRIESGKIKLRVSPYVDPLTNCLVTKLTQCDYAEWVDCTPNNQPDWLAYRPQYDPLCTLYLKCKLTGNIYFISN